MEDRNTTHKTAVSQHLTTPRIVCHLLMLKNSKANDEVSVFHKSLWIKNLLWKL